MRRFLLVALLLSGVLAVSPGGVVAAETARHVARPEVSAGGFSAYRLDNGFRILLVPFPAAATTRVELLVKAGSKLEGYGETGSAHLLEHMLFKRAGRHGDLKQALNALGATWNGTTNADRTNYFSTVPAVPDKVDALIRLEADRFLRPGYTAADLASEMSVVRNELERNDNEPASVLRRALQRQSFFWHGYGRPTLGARSDIESIPVARLEAFRKRYYRPDNAVLIVSGKFDATRVLRVAAAAFGPAVRPAEPLPGDWTREEQRGGQQRSRLFLPLGKTMLGVAWRLPGLADRQSAALELATATLCADGASGFNRWLGEGRQTVLTVDCQIDAKTDYSLLVASLTAEQGADAAQLAALLSGRLEQIARSGLTADRLERARLRLHNAYRQATLSHENVAASLSRAETAGDWRLHFQRRDWLGEIALPEVNQALRRWLVANNRAEVWLLHADSPADAPQEAPVSGAALAAQLAGRDWASQVPAADPLPTTLAELAAQVRQPRLLSLPEARVALLPRHNAGERAFLSLSFDYGNPAALSGRGAACELASALLDPVGRGPLGRVLKQRLDGWSARATFNLTTITLDAPAEHLLPALREVLAVWRSEQPGAERLDERKRARLAALQASREMPGSVAAQQASLRFDNYPPGHPNKPLPADDAGAAVSAVTLADVQACLDDFRGRGPARLAVVGPFDDAALETIGAAIAELPPAREPWQRQPEPAAPASVDTTPIVVALPQKPNAQVFGQAVLPLTEDDPDLPALRLAVHLLGGDSDSRLRARLREQEGLAYFAGASLVTGEDAPRAGLSLSASVASGQAERALEMLREELARALREGFSAAEVARGKAALAASQALRLGNERALWGLLQASLRNGRDLPAQIARQARLGALDVDEVNAALRRHLGPAAIVWGIGKGR